MMASEDTESPITVVRNAVLEFLEEMNKNRRLVEQEIRDRTDAVLTQFFNQGLVQYARSDIQDFNRRHREAFLEYYRNIIFLRVIAEASKQIRVAIEEGFNNPQVIQDEWMKGINEVKGQLVHMNELMETVQNYKQKIDEQQALIAELSSSSSMSSSDLELYQKALEERDDLIRERDQIILEKDNEIQNLTQGLQHMEDQSNNLGQTLLEYNMNIEELQETINDRDVKIEQLQQALRDQSTSGNEVEALRNQLQEAENTIRKLEQRVSTASAELVTELQDSLEKTRSQVLELRREIVQKNDRIHNMEVEKEELLIENKSTKEKLKTAQTQFKETENLYSALQETFNTLNSDIEKYGQKSRNLETELQKTKSELKEATDKLLQYEGKESISAEEKEKISSHVTTLEKQMVENKTSLEYLTKLLGNDIKFKTLFFLQSISGEMRIDNLAQGVGVPVNIIHRVLIELNKEKLVNTRKDGRYLFAEVVDRNSPFLLN
ncbi:MAG: hypothetical protein INQ03_04520 [Candidatus Heimdallarchaeota archaeon]|nr:hypothetical protein [Candidatus Heimdallarchaeota archaeon]